jgi:hypothetical protein
MTHCSDHRWRPVVILIIALNFSVASVFAAQPANLLADPSFESTKDRDQFGLVFSRWGGWKYEGDCEFRVGSVAHSGRHSCLLFGVAGVKIRVAQNLELAPGRYRITAYIRGLDIGTGRDGGSTEFMFGGKYMPLRKNGSFGWTKLTYVGEILDKSQAGPSFGLMAPGWFWIDEVSLIKVGASIPLTRSPILGPEEIPIVAPSEIPADAIVCRECHYKSQAGSTACYACGSPLPPTHKTISGPSVKLICSFENGNPFSGGMVVESHASHGRKALRIDRSYISIDQPQDWSAYDFLEADLYTEANKSVALTMEIRDRGTRDYWTRVNYNTIIPPGSSKLIVPLKQLYVGEKSRPGRMLDLAAITRVVFAIDEKSAAPLFIDNLRLTRDDSASRVRFEGLHAFDFGTGSSPVMDGFTPVTPGSIYTRGKGFGLKNARIWRAFDALQPEPLYQDFLCIEAGGLAVDVPDGRYRVVVNIDSPSGFWGKYQTYKKRAILAEGRPVVQETMDFATLKARYFRFWNVDDLPTDNTFDKYQRTSFQEKRFDVDVKDSQLNLEFEGENWACAVSSVIVYPANQSTRGDEFLRYVENKRRFYFDNSFKRVLPAPNGDSLRPTDNEQRNGFVLFQRDPMSDVSYNDTPFDRERIEVIRGDAFAGEFEPLTIGVAPLEDLGKVELTVSDLASATPSATIPASAIEVGVVSYRLSRVTMDGSVYTIAPRLIIPGGSAEMPRGITRRFWLTARAPVDTRPGMYRGTLTIVTEKAGRAQIPLAFRVRAGMLDPVDIPVGPFGYSISAPGFEDDPIARQFNQRLTELSLRRLREYGFTTFSGQPAITLRGFANGNPILDFSKADILMKQARDLGFQAVSSYGSGLSGLNTYFIDRAAMASAGYTDYPTFVRSIYSAIDRHAKQNGWLPVYYYLADEPVGDDLVRSAENAEAYEKAFGQGPPFFSGASSFTGGDKSNPHFRLSKALTVVSWNDHDEAGVKLLHSAGRDWAFYNGANRWTFGIYMYKAAKQFGMKFRLAWHWNAAAGDPYYALDCREDDFAWCNASPDGRLIPSVEFERIREGLDDYRRLITLDRLAHKAPNSNAAIAARSFIDKRMAAFKLGQRDHDSLFPADDWTTFRRDVDDLIEALRK